MKQLKIWLIEKSNIQTNVIAIILVLTIARTWIIDRQVRQTKDFYTPIIYLLLVLWVYYSLLYRVVLDNAVNEKIIIKSKFEELEDLTEKFIKLSVLIIFSYHTFFIFERSGVIFSLILIMLTGSLCIYFIGKNIWNEGHSPADALQKFAIAAGFVGYIYFIPWKDSFCHEFGIKEIGNYFEKDTYTAKYLVNVRRVHSNIDPDVYKKLIDDYSKAINEILENIESETEYTYKLPADIIVSDDFSEYEDYETDDEVYSNETIETRKVKVLKVYFNNGSCLYFNDCFVPINNSDDCNCLDQNGNEWEVELTKVKIE